VGDHHLGRREIERDEKLFAFTADVTANCARKQARSDNDPALRTNKVPLVCKGLKGPPGLPAPRVTGARGEAGPLTMPRQGVIIFGDLIGKFDAK